MIKIYESTDYEVLKRYWEGHGFPVVPQVILPRLGACSIGEDGTILAAGFLYMDNSVGVSMMEWLVTNPDIGGIQSYKAIREVVDFLGKEARSLGYGVMLTTCKQASLGKAYERLGFVRTDEGMIHFIKSTEEG